MLTRLRLGLSHLRYHKCRHNFQYCIKPICVWGIEIETTTHFLLHCPLIQCARQSLLTSFKKIDESILKKHGKLITKTLLYGDDKFDLSCNKSLIFSTIEFIVSTERSSNSLVYIFSSKLPYLSHNLNWPSILVFFWFLGFFRTFNTVT